MKVILDANVFLSYLLAPTTERVITTSMKACFTENVDLFVPPELLAEIVDELQNKPYFRERVPQNLVVNFIQQMTLLADFLAPLEIIPSFSRDPDDDYLLAYGVINEIDYLVTAARDLLVLQQVTQVHIVKPSIFLQILREQGFLSG